MVIGYHYFTGFYIFDFGWIGVDLFFVLSGYLLSGRLYPFLQDRKLLYKFYRNRFLRIVPLFYIFLAVFFLFWFGMTSKATADSMPLYRTYIPGFFGFTANWIFIITPRDSFVHLNHLWSLAVEEQFYIVFPLLVILIRDKKRLLYSGLALLVIILLCRCLYYYYHPDEDHELYIYWNSFFRADSFLTGFVLYMALQNGFGTFLKKYAALIAMLAGIVIIAGGIAGHSFRLNAFFVTAGFTAIAVLCACLVFYAGTEIQTPLLKILSSPFIRYSGKISYGLYIFHWPVYLFGFTAVHFLLGKAGWSPGPVTVQLINACVSLILSYLLSILSFHYLESYFLKWKISPVAKPAEKKAQINESS